MGNFHINITAPFKAEIWQGDLCWGNLNVSESSWDELVATLKQFDFGNVDTHPLFPVNRPMPEFPQDPNDPPLNDPKDPNPGGPKDPNPGGPKDPNPGGPKDPNPGGPKDPNPGGPKDPNPGGPKGPNPGGPKDPNPGGPKDPSPGRPKDPFPPSPRPARPENGIRIGPIRIGPIKPKHEGDPGGGGIHIDFLEAPIASDTHVFFKMSDGNVLSVSNQLLSQL